ncbi:HAD family hydrolase [Candidatus Micrarchaeota archaeon]|nr:HAD family hydrolase [Candidatus Micrarchaeota archaeon]
MEKIIMLDWNGTMVKKNTLDEATKLRSETINAKPNINHKEALKQYSGIMDDPLLNIELTHLLNVHYLHIVNIKGDDIFYHNVLDYVHNWSSRGYKLVIVSKMWKKTVEQSLELLGLTKLFKDVYGNSQEMIYDKKSIIEMVLTEMGKPLVFIGDDNEDVTASKSTGIKNGIVTWGRAWSWDIYPDYLMETFREVDHLLDIYENIGQI